MSEWDKIDRNLKLATRLAKAAAVVFAISGVMWVVAALR